MAKEQKQEEAAKVEPKLRFEVVRVPTGEALMIQDTASEDILDEKQTLAQILNMLSDIKKAVA